MLLEGKPLPKARVRFCPEPGVGADYTAEGVTDDQGLFTLTCHGQPGAVAGENHVVVMEDAMPPGLTKSSARAKLTAYLAGLPNRPIPAHYSNAAETPLKIEVVAGRKFHIIKLKRLPR